MNGNDYAFAVSAVRELENGLLDDNAFLQLSSQNDIETAITYLAGKGYNGIEKANDLNNYLQQKLNNTFNELVHIAPNPKQLDFLAVENDFHNLKASLKAIVTDKSCENLFKYPCICNPNTVYDAVKQKQFDELPQFLSDTAQNAYELITSTLDGQLTDIYIDRCSLECLKSKAYSTQNSFIIDYAETVIAIYNIKSALRIAHNGGKAENLSDIFAECIKTDIDVLKNKCGKSVNEVTAYVEQTDFKNLAAAYKKSYAEFEKECTGIIDDLCGRAKFVSFGIEPLIAYYREVYNEIMKIRLILSQKMISV